MQKKRALSFPAPFKDLSSILTNEGAWNAANASLLDFLLQVYVVLWVRYGDSLIVKTFFDGSSQVPMDRPIVRGVCPGADDKIDRQDNKGSGLNSKTQFKET